MRSGRDANYNHISYLGSAIDSNHFAANQPPRRGILQCAQAGACSRLNLPSAAAMRHYAKYTDIKLIRAPVLNEANNLLEWLSTNNCEDSHLRVWCDNHSPLLTSQIHKNFDDRITGGDMSDKNHSRLSTIQFLNPKSLKSRLRRSPHPLRAEALTNKINHN